jgi:raffinose/stachyose/melibiose transport system permease protein
VGLFRYTWKSFGRELMLLAFAVVFCIPLYIAAALSLKSQSDTYLKPLAVPTHPVFGNFSTALRGTSSASVSRALLNNAIITTATVVAVLVLGSLCAYTIARRRTRLSTTLYLVFVAGLIFPYQLGIVPLYILLRHLGLIGTYLGIIFLYTGLFMPLAVFLFVGFIRALPREYEEAAQVDGAGLFRTLFRVVLPLIKPIIGTIAILTGIFAWNEFFLSVIFLSGTPNQTLSVAIYAFVGQYAAQWNLVFATVLISIAPILLFYLFAQRQLIKGFSGGVRG